MTEEEIKVVAEVLAKVGGNWYPDRAQSAPKPIAERQREVARLIVAAVERTRAAHRSAAETGSASERPLDVQPANGAENAALQVGESVVYRPPGDKRTQACRIEKLEGDQAYVVPELREIGWVSTHSLLPLNPNRDNGAQPQFPFPVPASISGTDSSAAEELSLAVPRRPRNVGSSTGVTYYFSSSGEWIAFRRPEHKRYLFGTKGNWIGWFPWDDNEIVDLNGQYLGTVFNKNRIYRKTPPDPQKREVGFMMDPGTARPVSDPGPTTPYVAPYGYKDVDMSQLPTRSRTGLRNRPGGPVRPRSMFEVLLSKIGMGGVARAIEGLFRSGN